MTERQEEETVTLAHMREQVELARKEADRNARRDCMRLLQLHRCRIRAYRAIEATIKE